MSFITSTIRVPTTTTINMPPPTITMGMATSINLNEHLIANLGEMAYMPCSSSQVGRLPIQVGDTQLDVGILSCKEDINIWVASMTANVAPIDTAPVTDQPPQTVSTVLSTLTPISSSSFGNTTASMDVTTGSTSTFTSIVLDTTTTIATLLWPSGSPPPVVCTSPMTASSTGAGLQTDSGHRGSASSLSTLSSPSSTLNPAPTTASVTSTAALPSDSTFTPKQRNCTPTTG